MPIWVVVIGLLFASHLLSVPFTWRRGPSPGEGLLSLVAVGLLGWCLCEHVPTFHLFVDRAMGAISRRPSPCEPARPEAAR